MLGLRLLGPQHCPARALWIPSQQAALYALQMENWDSEKPGFVVTLNPGPSSLSSAPAAASWGFSSLPTPSFAWQTVNTVYGWISGAQALSMWCRPGRGRGSGDRFQAAPGPAPTPVPEAPGCGVVGGCAYIYKARRNQPRPANRLSKHCW